MVQLKKFVFQDSLRGGGESVVIGVVVPLAQLVVQVVQPGPGAEL